VVLRVLLHSRARSDRTSNFSLFSPPDPLRPPRGTLISLYKPYKAYKPCVSLYRLISLLAWVRTHGFGAEGRGSSPGGRKNGTAQMGSGPLGSPPDCVCPPKSGSHHGDPTGFRTRPQVGPGRPSGAQGHLGKPYGKLI
jgi:hypothetical protein